METAQLVYYLIYTALILLGLYFAYKKKLFKNIATTKKSSKTVHIINTILAVIFLVIGLSGLVSLITLLLGLQTAPTTNPFVLLLTTALFGGAGAFLLYITFKK